MAFGQRVAHGDRMSQGLHQRIRPEPQGADPGFEVAAGLAQLTPVQEDARQGHRRRGARLAGERLIGQPARAGQVPEQCFRKREIAETAEPLMGGLRGRDLTGRPEDPGGPAEVTGPEVRPASRGQHLDPHPRMAVELRPGDVLQQLLRPGRGARRRCVVPGAARIRRHGPAPRPAGPGCPRPRAGAPELPLPR